MRPTERTSADSLGAHPSRVYLNSDRKRNLFLTPTPCGGSLSCDEAEASRASLPLERRQARPTRGYRAAVHLNLAERQTCLQAQCGEAVLGCLQTNGFEALRCIAD